MPEPRRADGAPRASCIAAIGLAVCLFSFSAEAHTALQGVGSFWSGVAHQLTSLDQLGFLLGLAIWTSFYDRRLDARVIATAFAAGLVGVWFGAYVDAAGWLNLATATAALMTTVGLAGAARLQLGMVPLLGLALIGGLVGGAAGAEAGGRLSVAIFSLGGSIATASILSYGLLAARPLDAAWGGIARRAGASWIAAIGLMVLALSLAGHSGRG
jgi:urease accessory protein